MNANDYLRDRRAADLPPLGTLLDGGYRLGNPLGEGGMGVVYRAFDTRLEREVAVKFVRPEYAENEAVRTQFVHEARAMARVRHANVVAIHTFGQYHGTPYFVMEYVPGTTLRDRLEQQGPAPMAVDEALGFLTQICKGLEAIHGADVVHHDIKPSNILISTSFRVAIADLGLVRVVGAAQTGASGSMAGTMSYMAPEVALAETVRPELAARADLYSLGVLAFELLTGQLPFEAANGLEMLQKHVEVEPPAASDVRPDLPASFDPVLRRVLAKDAANRMASARAFFNALMGARPKYQRFGT